MHGRLLLCVEADMVPPRCEPVPRATLGATASRGAASRSRSNRCVEAERGRGTGRAIWSRCWRRRSTPPRCETVTGGIARCGGNIERIVRLAAYPVHSYELSVAGADVDSLRRALAESGRPLPGRHRRAGGGAAPAGQAPDRPGRGLDPAAGRGDRPAGRALRLRCARWPPSRRRPWRASSTSPRRCAGGCGSWPA